MIKIKYTIAITLVASITLIAISTVQSRNTSKPEDTVINFAEAYQYLDWEKAENEITDSKLVNEKEYLIGIRSTIKVGEKVKERYLVYTVELIENEWKITNSIFQKN